MMEASDWEIADDSPLALQSVDFAQVFYEELLKGKPIGGTVRKVTRYPFDYALSSLRQNKLSGQRNRLGWVVVLRATGDGAEANCLRRPRG